MSHWQSKAKRNKADVKFSEWIRKRDKKCQFGIKCIPVIIYRDDGTVDIRHLDNVHFKGRARWNTRFDPENGDAGCKKCHHYFHNDKEGKKAHKDWKKKQMGDRYNALVVRANQVGKKDIELNHMIYKKLLKEMEEE